MTKDPGDFWAAIGVGVNVLLGMVAFFAFKASRDSAEASRDSANYAHQQAESAEAQTRVVIESARFEREQLAEQKKREQELLWPSIYPSFTYSGDGYSLMLVNGSHYPVVFENITFKPTNNLYERDGTRYSFIYKDNPILTEEGKNLRRIVRPGEGISIIYGSYVDWAIAFQAPWQECDDIRVAVDDSGRRDLVDSQGIPADRLELRILDGYFSLEIPFTYISPAAKSYTLALEFETDKWAGFINLHSSLAVQSSDGKIFSQVLRPVTPEDVARHSSLQP